MQDEMVEIETEKGHAAQDMNWRPAAVQRKEGMEVKNQWQHSQSAQSAERTGKEHAPK